MIVRTADPVLLRATLVQAAEDTGVDIAVEPAGLRRRAKRLVVLDVDSTLIQDEAIDLLAERAGVSDAGRDDHRTGDGRPAGLRRVAAGAGRAACRPAGGEVDAVRDALRLTPGARTFVRTLRRLGFHVGVVSGGFTVFTDRFVARAGAGVRGGQRAGDRRRQGHRAGAGHDHRPRRQGGGAAGIRRAVRGAAGADGCGRRRRQRHRHARDGRVWVSRSTPRLRCAPPPTRR